MAIKVTLFNKGINITSVTYNNWTNDPKTISLLGGQKLEIENTYEEDSITGDDVPTNILNLHPLDADVVIGNFSYDPKQVNIKIETL